MKKILLTLIIGMFLISFASAFLGTYESGEEVSVRAELVATSVNVTIYFPNSTIAINNQLMTNLFGDIYNFSFNNTDELGEYIYDYCDQDGNNCVQNNFVITPTGNVLDQPQSLIVIGLTILLLILAIIFLYIGIKIEYVPFKIFLISLSALFLMLTIGFSVNIIKELLIVGSVLSGTFVNLYRLMLILVSAGGIGLMVYIVYMSVRQFYSHRGLIDRIDD